MIFSDIVTLAKAGWKPSDVKEWFERCETDPSVKQKETPEEVKNGETEKPDTTATDAFEELAKL